MPCAVSLRAPPLGPIFCERSGVEAGNQKKPDPELSPKTIDSIHLAGSIGGEHMRVPIEGDLSVNHRH